MNNREAHRAPVDFHVESTTRISAARLVYVIPSDDDLSVSAVRPRADERPRRDIDEVSRLEEELIATRDSLRSVVAEHQAATDALAAANEELVSTNEELQSTNEELRSTKEGLRSANEARNMANEELRSSNPELDQVARFLATLSHELRTPLSSMLLEAQLLGRIAGDDGRLRRATASIERSAKTQARLIEDLLDVSCIVSGKLVLDRRALDLKEIVQRSVYMAVPAAQAKALELQLKAPDDFAGTVHGDAVRLQQVVTNLLANAIKFTPRGGRIEVRLERTGDQAEITVTDTGMGIRAEVLPQLFERSFQAHSSVTRVHGGLGLGLAIVRHLVEAHGGQVRAESPGEGKGATLCVRLPMGPRGRNGPKASRRRLPATSPACACSGLASSARSSTCRRAPPGLRHRGLTPA